MEFIELETVLVVSFAVASTFSLIFMGLIVKETVAEAIKIKRR